MKRKLMALLMTVMLLVMSAAPVMAEPPPKQPNPVAPPGLDRGPDDGPGSPAHKEEARPDQAEYPVAGPINRFFQGCPQATKCS